VIRVSSALAKGGLIGSRTCALDTNGAAALRFRFLITIPVAVIAIGLASCAETAQQAREAGAFQQAKEAETVCVAKFSESDHDAVARAKCINDAEKIIKSVYRYPDLVDLRIAKRVELAERQAAGKITRAQLVLALRELTTSITSEEQQRDASSRVARAQEMSAAAMYPVAQPPVTTFTADPSIYTLQRQPPPAPIGVPVPNLGSVYYPPPPPQQPQSTPADRLRDCAQTSSCTGVFSPGPW
jgi:hypothetical protein